MPRRSSKMKCKRTLRKNSKLPPFDARSCPDKIKKGKNATYKSVEKSNGIWMWKKVK